LAVSRKSPNSLERIVAAVAEERRRISRELHDRALQLLSGVKMRADTCRHQFLDNRQALDAELQAIAEGIDRAITEIRNLITESQSPEELPSGSLERRLKEELGIFRARTGFKLDFQCTIGAHHLPSAIEKELYFTLREGVLNAVRHSRASELHLSLSKNKQGYEAKLSDNGVGFDPSSAEGNYHYGLKGMKERIQKLGGQFTLKTAPGKGTQIEILIPFDHA
jgi:two-component system sensor histidine kinase DegS